MKTTVHTLVAIAALLLTVTSCHSQVGQAVRQPAVAGQFYPSGKAELSESLNGLFTAAVRPRGITNVLAIIAPHAGYQYSGQVAASAFNQIDPTKTYDNVFILGPSHHVGFEGAAVYTHGDYATPLGVVKTNRELALQLSRKSPLFVVRDDAHASEHSIEVQLPFLQRVMKRDFRIVPIVLGADGPATCARIADVLRPYFNERNLFIVSTDFSHYPAYNDAVVVDKATADAVLSNSPQTLLRTLDANDKKGVGNLVTSMCGWSCVLTLLSMTGNMPQCSYQAIEYRNSGDVDIGDKHQVVGYYAIAVSLKDLQKSQGFSLDPNDKETLLALARSTIEQYLRSETVLEPDLRSYSPALNVHCGAFVTLQEHGALRGCIGRFEPDEPLFRVVQQMAIAAATQDYRFPTVEPKELATITIEISVLTPMRKVSTVNDIELGKHGIYIKKGDHSGTFLPQVATETGWSKEEFLGHCSQDKAGLGWNGWKEAEIFVYEALVFGEHDVKAN